MRIEDVRRHATTPLTRPAFAPVTLRFTDREYLCIIYRTDPDALRAVVPERRSAGSSALIPGSPQTVVDRRILV